MKHVIILFVMVTLVSPVFAQSCAAPVPIDKEMAVGKWNGNYTYKGTSVPFTVTFKMAGSSLTSVFAFSKNDPEITFRVLECNSGDLHIIQKVNDLEMEFKGIPEGDTFAGKLKIKTSSGESFQESFDLVRDK